METHASPPSTVFLPWNLCVSQTDMKPTIAEIRGLCESFTELNLLARLSLSEWSNCVDRIWLHLSTFDAVKTKRPYRCGVDIRSDQLWMFYISMDSPRETTERFDSLVNRAAVLGCELPVSDFQVHVRIVLDFVSPWRDNETDPEARLVHELEEILDLVQPATSRSTTQAATSVRCPALQIKEVCFDSTFGHCASAEMLECMTHLMASGVRVRELSCFKSTDRVSLMKSVQQLIPSREAPSISTLIVSDSCSNVSLVAVLSALTCSISVHEVIVQCGTSRPGLSAKDFWRWVTYAVVSRDTSHNVRQLRLQPRSLSRSDVEIVRQVLEADDPLALIMQVSRDAALKGVYISASQFYFTTFSSIQAEKEPDFTSSEPLVVPVIAEIDGDWSVLLPGYGTAWVQDSSGRVVEKIKDQAHASSHRLKIRCDLVSQHWIDATVKLFSLIGDHVDAIDLQRSVLNVEPFEEDAESLLKKILKVSPRLEDIEIGDVGVSTLSLFADTVNTLRVSKLVITECVDVTQNINSVGRFLEALSTPSHPLAESLRDLQFHVKLNTGQCKAFGDIMRAMTHRNHRLRGISLVLTAVDDEEDLIGDTLGVIVDEPGLYAVPLNPKSKLAFLSAISQAICIIAEALDSGVSANIFAFAAPLKPRRFHIIYQ